MVGSSSHIGVVKKVEGITVSKQEADYIEPGRPVVLTKPLPGLWMTTIGAAVMALGPLFGFLYGSMRPVSASTDELVPIYWGMFIGMGVGAIFMMFGIRRLWLEIRARQRAGHEEGE